MVGKNSGESFAEYIKVRGAAEHNLKDVSIDIPKRKLVVISGVSGSGKSSLAFDTLYAEGQRRYVESLSAYARQFLELMKKPQLDSIEGLCPSISIEQRSPSRTPRSTVGTVTEIYDYLRLLFARIGIPHSPTTGKPITAQSVRDIINKITAMPEGRKLHLLAPIIRARKGEHKQVLEELMQQGFTRVLVDGKLYADMEKVPPLKRNNRHDIELVVDRLRVKKDMGGGEDGERLADSIETALDRGNQTLIVTDTDSGERWLFSSRFACPVSGFTIEEIEPRLFSFNSPQGACESCNGLGFSEEFDENLVIPSHDLGLGEGLIAPWRGSRFRHSTKPIIEALQRALEVGEATPWSAFPAAAKRFLLNGDNEDNDKGNNKGNGKPLRLADGLEIEWNGVLAMLNRQYQRGAIWIKDDLSRFMSQKQCPTCGGRRLRPQALAVKVNGLDISRVTAMTVKDCQNWFAELAAALSGNRKTIAAPILREVEARLSFLAKVGLNYLTLGRTASTLSGGEAQRIRLASQIGSGLTGVLYVLDEPSIGLHQRDNLKLLETLFHLRGLGNSVVVVEHDMETIAAADWVIDMGPAAGVGGGRVIDQASPKQLAKSGKGITADYLTGRKTIAVPTARTPPKKGFEVVLEGAKGHNLKNIKVRFPLGLFICITGVSGSGKSTLITNSLIAALDPHSKTKPCPFKALRNRELVDETINIDQSPIGRTPRSNPTTYVGAFTHIRNWFAELPISRQRGWKPGRFSFNVGGGRCENCEGAGIIRIPMSFLADTYVRCDVCKGARYNPETLRAVYRHKNISQVLDMTVDEAIEFFRAVPSVKRRLNTLKEVGLGYMELGQGAPTLSGGEAQRVRLARELNRRPQGHVIYAFDEPTVGLHSQDVARLLEVLDALKAAGHTLIVIEHNLDVIKHADWVIDLGPEGGADGGRVMAEGTPEQVAKQKNGFTNEFLRRALGG